jgi:hypothetical protein
MRLCDYSNISRPKHLLLNWTVLYTRFWRILCVISKTVQKQAIAKPNLLLLLDRQEYALESRV